MEQAKIVAEKLWSYKHSVQNFLRIYSYSSRLDRVWLAVAALSSAGTGATIPLMNIIFAKLVRVFTAFYARYYTGWTPEKFRDEIAKNVIYMLYIFAARFVLDYIAVFGFRHVGLKVSANIRLRYLQCLMALPVSNVDGIPQGHTAAIITVTATQLQDGISEKLCLLIQSISLIVSAIVVAFVFSWLLAAVTVSGFFFVVLVYSMTLYFLVKKWKLIQEAEREGAGTASETISSIRMVAACGAEGKMAESYGKWVGTAAKYGQQMSIWIAVQYSFVFFAVYATAALCFWWAVRLYSMQKIANVEVLLVVITSILTIVMSAGSISAPLSAVSRASAAASAMYTIIDAPKAKLTGLKEPEASATQDIVLSNVNFTYTARPDQRVLLNVSLNFPAGRTTAIVGPSGSGKSTIVALIQRWYELAVDDDENPIFNLLRNGSISIGGHELHELDVKWWRSQIGLVQQEPFLFNGTIFENVAYGLIGTKWEEECEEIKRNLVVEACKEAFADEFISELPDSYETLCGDAGILLSGGQRQRIAIARCIIKQPSIVILDEATSAIDVRSEQKVHAALERASMNRTTIVIAHRLSTIQKADNIIVLQKGMVMQQGSHEKLMKNRAGLYHRLVKAQLLSEADTKRNSIAFSEDYEFPETKLELDLHTPDDYDETSKDIPMDTTSTLRKTLRTLSIMLVEQKKDWYWYVLILLASAGAGAAFPVQAFLFAHLISLFAYYGEYLHEQTNFWCLITVALAVGVGVCYFILGWSCNRVSFRIVSAYRHEYFRNLLRQPITYFDDKDNSTGALSARVAYDPAQLQQLLGVNAASMLTCIFNVIGCIIISFYFSWRLSVVVVLSSTPIMIAAGYLRVRYERKFAFMTWTVFSESSKFVTESIGAFRTVSALTMEDFVCKRYETLLRKQVTDSFRGTAWATLIFSFSDSIALLCMAFALWYGGHLLSNYELWPFDYLVVYLSVIQGSLAAGQWLSFGPNIAQASTAISRIHELRNRTKDPDHDDRSSMSTACDDEKSVQGPRIELRNVWLKYPTRDVEVLQGLNMTIENGQFAAIVGPSGCGKTSIINLLERFYNAQSGQVLMDGKSISSIDLHEYRENVSLVAQEPGIISGSLRDNIVMGVDPRTVTESDLDRVCRETEMYDYIASFPITYDTLVGQKGISLSGGQRQRLSIARALLREPKLMLLDEATSNLDSETERSIQKIFEKTGKGRTMIVVAHRLATVQNADVIFVMSEGQVVEQGKHRELLRKKGVYWQMCQMQALDK